MRFSSRRARWAASAAAVVGLNYSSPVRILAAELPALRTPAAEKSNTPLVRSYQAPSGETYLSVSVSAKSLPTAGTVHQHVVLVDTSASQVGEHRKHALNVLQTMLVSLPAGDRVAVVAVDVKAAPMTDGLVAPDVAAKTGLAALNRRVPAGSTDLVAGLNAALAQFDASQPGSIIVIGDGMSAAHLVQNGEFDSITSQLRNARVSVSSYAVGSTVDMQLLGALATKTGGVVKHDEGGTSAEEAGRQLAAAAQEGVFYPQALNVSWDGAEVLPANPLPMRSDRASVYLVRGRVAPKASLSVTGELNGKNIELSWSVGEPQVVEGTTVLGHLWQQAAQNQGDTLALAGDELVSYAQEQMLNQVQSLEATATQALKDGQVDVAHEVGRVLQQYEPTNVRAIAFQDAAAEDAAPAEEPPVEPAPPAAGIDLTPREEPSGQDAIARLLAQRQALAGKLRRELEEDIRTARDELNISPGSAVARMEQALSTVKSATDIDRDDQEKLIRYATSTLQDFRSKEAAINAGLSASQRAVAEQQASARLTDQLTTEQQTLKNLVDQVRAAMSDGFHGNPDAFEQAEEIGRIIFSREPGSATGASTVFVPEAAGALDKAARLRSLRSDKFLAQLHQVELSHVPFPDEPPVNYPPAEVWQNITQLRKKWKSVDLHKNSPNEQRIYDALDRTADFQFVSQTLEQVLSFISQSENITIRPETQILTDAGVTMDSEVTLVISGISLRAALKLLLENVNGTKLTYVIEDEVMKITTDEAEKEKMTTRVYPVGDLAIQPFRQTMSARMGLMMGMMGGGGMGGGMGGMGGGMGGMGGGMMSVPNAPLTTDVEAPKKKL